MNRSLLQALLVLFLLSVLQGQSLASTAIPKSQSVGAAFLPHGVGWQPTRQYALFWNRCTFSQGAIYSGAATSNSATPADKGDGTEEEYIESKFFPKKGSYSDWLAANKLSNQGIRLARSRQYKSAISMFQQAIQRYSYDYTYYEHLGAVLRNSGNLEKAESTTEMATQMAPNQWGPWYNLGLILTQEHEYKRALAALKRAKTLRVPANKSAGMNKLIVSLQHSLNQRGTPPGLVTPATAEKVAPPETTVSQTEPVSPDVNSSAPEPAPVLDSNTTNPNNPYTTVPEVSPVPSPQSTTSEKGN